MDDILNIKIKKLTSEAIIPTYSKNGDVGMDLTAIAINLNGYIEYKTGLAIEIPNGYFGMIRPRSSISKTGLLFHTSGIVDSGYRGEILVRFCPKYYTRNWIGIPREEFLKEMNWPLVGERIAQLIILPYPQINFIEVSELSQTERGTGGHGSTN